MSWEFVGHFLLNVVFACLVCCISRQNFSILRDCFGVLCVRNWVCSCLLCTWFNTNTDKWPGYTLTNFPQISAEWRNFWSTSNILVHLHTLQRSTFSQYSATNQLKTQWNTFTIFASLNKCTDFTSIW